MGQETIHTEAIRCDDCKVVIAHLKNNPVGLDDRLAVAGVTCPGLCPVEQERLAEYELYVPEENHICSVKGCDVKVRVIDKMCLRCAVNNIMPNGPVVKVDPIVNVMPTFICKAYTCQKTAVRQNHFCSSHNHIEHIVPRKVKEDVRSEMPICMALSCREWATKDGLCHLHLELKAKLPPEIKTKLKPEICSIKNCKKTAVKTELNNLYCDLHAAH